MLKNKLLIAAFILLAIGFGIGRYTVPNNLQEISKTEKESKTEETIIVKEETKPDGTVVKETTKTKKKEDSSKKEDVLIVENKKPDWKASALVGYNFDKSKVVYGAMVDRRVLGNIFVGVGATTDKQALLSLSMEF